MSTAHSRRLAATTIRDAARARRRLFNFWPGGRALDLRARRAGFTLIGLLIFVAMTGIGLTVISQIWVTVQKRDKEAELLFIGDQFRRAFTLYGANGAAGPRQLEDLIKDPRLPDTRRYLRKLYRDPITGRAEWGVLRSTGDTIIGVYSLSEEEPLKKSEFKLVDIAFEGKTKYTEWVFFPRARRATAGQPVPLGSANSPGDKSLPQPGLPQVQPDRMQTPPVTIQTQSGTTQAETPPSAQTGAQRGGLGAPGVTQGAIQ
ncbi:MAG: hypothetical protein JWN94_3854 [Betaproteobacteria bacterium]|nr:hypothetical protein [Betaproteobacteria bacterium]